MKKLLLFSLFFGSAVMFSMEENNYLQTDFNDQINDFNKRLIEAKTILEYAKQDLVYFSDELGKDNEYRAPEETAHRLKTIHFIINKQIPDLQQLILNLEKQKK